jgi:hypothetical protein
MTRTLRTKMKYRAVVTAGRTWKSTFGQEYRQVAERCVYLEAYNSDEAAARAESVVQTIYPEANVFDVYNVVDEITEPDSVLEFVVGSSATQVLVDGSPIVMWNFRDIKTSEWKERMEQTMPTDRGGPGSVGAAGRISQAEKQ